MTIVRPQIWDMLGDSSRFAQDRSKLVLACVSDL